MQTDKWGQFQKFLITENSNISIPDFLINAAILILLGLLLEYTYRKCGKSLSNRRGFAANFVLLSFTTMIIIVTVKSSLALSLGLVGALSIVRFRAAIKEPEELVYLFFAISMGLVMGANQRLIALLGFAIVMVIIWGRFIIAKPKNTYNLFMTVSSRDSDKLQLDDILKEVNSAFGNAQLKRFDEAKDGIEASFLIEIMDSAKLQECKNKLQEISPDVKVSFIDNSQI